MRTGSKVLVPGLGDSLGSALPDLKHDGAGKGQKMARSHKKLAPVRRRGQSEKSRKATLEEEMLHIAEVLDHEAYQANPFSALREHLTNTVVQPDAVLQVPDAPAPRVKEPSDTGTMEKRRAKKTKKGSVTGPALEIEEARSAAKRPGASRQMKRLSVAGGVSKKSRSTSKTKSGKIGVKRPKI